MWPILLDMTKEESMQHLRCLEIDAFSGLVSALRAQGALDSEKLKILKETGSILHISQERHKAEVRRVVNDEKLCTIAYHVNGEKHSNDEWAEEGQRLIPLMARIAPQTAYSAIADEVADTASKINKQLPSPSCTERKRPPPISPTHINASTSDGTGKNMQFRLSEPEIKKRKLSLSVDNNNMMGPPKISKIQQIYRQKSKTRQKEQVIKMKPQDGEMPKVMMQSPMAKMQTKVISASSQISPKINILQNISIHGPTGGCAVEEQRPEPSCGGSAPAPLPSEDAKDESKPVPNHHNKVYVNAPNISGSSVVAAGGGGSGGSSGSCTSGSAKVNQLTIKAGGGANEVMQKTFKVCTPRKPIPPTKTVTTSSGQKLIVVSTPQTLTSSTIIQRTLSTFPLKNFSMKNLDKVKIVSGNATTAPAIHIQNSVKQKVVTMRTTANKKIMPVQVLNTKTGIKVLPIGGKIISKNGEHTSEDIIIDGVDQPLEVLNIVSNMDSVTNQQNCTGATTILNTNTSSTNCSSSEITNNDQVAVSVLESQKEAECDNSMN